jgi:hypothetical protein
VKISELSNQELWDEWKTSLESAALEPDNGNVRRREEACLNEIVRRIQEASRRPLRRQEA